MPQFYLQEALFTLTSEDFAPLLDTAKANMGVVIGAGIGIAIVGGVIGWILRNVKKAARG